MGENMAKSEKKAVEEPGNSDDFERVPVMQRVLDNPFLLLFIGVTVPAVFYLMWGIMEVAQIPIAQ
jgi:hypothetical protein